MPLALDPHQTFTIVLESDKDKPAESRPCFIYRYLTGRQWNKVPRLHDTLEDSAGADDVTDKMYQAASTGLVSWKNMIAPNGEQIGYEPDKLQDILGIIEAQELIAKLLKQHPSLDDKKKLDSPSQSSTEKSAPAAKGD